MSLSLRAGALLAAGTLAVHELRYLVGLGPDAAAAARGHGYVAWLAPLLALALALACGAWLARVGRRDDRPAGRTLTWLGASGTLMLAYTLQETLESLAAPGHDGLLAHGGWVAAPIALVVGGLLSLMLRGAHAADRVAATAARPWSPWTVVPGAARLFALPVPALLAHRRHALARRLAGRGPPTAS